MSSSNSGVMSGLPGIQAPDVLLPQVREPDRAVADADGVPARTEPLLDHLVVPRIDLRQRDLEDRDPHIAGAVGDLATATRGPDDDIRDQLPALHVHARDRAVALVQRPDRSTAGGREPRARTDVNPVGD